MELLASVDGEIVAAEQATVPATDDGLLRGDGVFEVIRLYAGRPFALADHLARMERSAANLRLPVDFAALRAEVDALLARAGDAEGLVRLVATRGGHRLALIERLPDLPATMRVAFVTYAPTRILDGVKSLSYAANMLAGRLARERGFDEALLVTPHGRVLEAPTASLFWVREGRLLTPPLDDHILDSITRARVMRAMEVEESPCTPDDLRAAEEAFLASTLREVMPIAAVEDVELPVDGPVSRDAAQRTRALIEAELAATASAA